MDETTLRKLLGRQESANLEFKRQWYDLESLDSKKGEASKGEMIKDILSLANGNTIVAGEKSYLIIGASNEMNENGCRELFDFSSQKPIARQRILDIVNPFCDPSIEDILCDEIQINGKQLLVITILPSPHVHETIQRIKTAKVTYDKYTVFVRHAEGVRTASTKERLALQELKALRFSETRNVPPIPFGAFMGALTMGLIGPKMLVKEGDSQEKITSATIASAGVGAFFGGMIGFNYSQIKTLPTIWQQSTPKGKTIGIMATSAFGLFFFWLISVLSRRNKKSNVANTVGVNNKLS
jgi:hypothetical protein